MINYLIALSPAIALSVTAKKHFVSALEYFGVLSFFFLKEPRDLLLHYSWNRTFRRLWFLQTFVFLHHSHRERQRVCVFVYLCVWVPLSLSLCLSLCHCRCLLKEMKQMKNCTPTHNNGIILKMEKMENRWNKNRIFSSKDSIIFWESTWCVHTSSSWSK